MVAAVTLVKDEIDIIEETVGRMCTQVDLVFVADNGSTDGTRELLTDLPVVLIDDDDPAHYQSRKISSLAERARQDGADWVVPFDADEIWLTREGSLADVLGALPDECWVAEAALIDHVAILGGPALSPYRRAEALPLRKIACRTAEGLVIHDGNHGVTFDTMPIPLSVTGQLEVRHFPYRSAEQMVRKARNGAAAMAATSLSEHIGQHWRDYGRLSDEQIHETFYGHFWSEDPEGDELIYDPVPAWAPSLS